MRNSSEPAPGGGQPPSSDQVPTGTGCTGCQVHREILIRKNVATAVVAGNPMVMAPATVFVAPQ